MGNEVAKVTSLIRLLRGQEVILDSDLARIYGVTTKRLNEQVKRNASRFPPDFLFQLTGEELETLKSQIAISGLHGGRNKFSCAFTKDGAHMAAKVVNSRKATGMSVYVLLAFIKLRDQRTTPEEIAEAKLKTIAVAEEKSGRTLTSTEREMFEDFEQSLGLWEAYQHQFKTCEPQWILDLFQDIGSNDNPVKLLKSLTNSPASIAKDRGILLRWLRPKARKIVGKVDLEDNLSSMSNWLLELVHCQPPPKSTQVVNFSLFESDGGFKLCITGANSFNARKHDWACSPDWSPERFAPLDELSKLWLPLKNAGSESWVVIQAIIIILVKAFFLTHAKEFQNASGLQKLHTMTGFVDGDLYEIRTKISPSSD